MTKLIKEIEKEIEKASKAYHKADSIMESLRGKGFNMTVAEGEKYSRASNDFEKCNTILSALYPMLNKLKSLNEN